MVSPALEQLARDLAGKVKLVKVNAGTSPQVSQPFGGKAIPVLLVLRHGQVAARQTGAVPLATLADLGRQCARRRLSIDAGCLHLATAPGAC